MGFEAILTDMVEEKLLNLHTAFVAKIVAMQGEHQCTVQPLDKIKAYGKKAQAHAVITKVPILNHVRHYELVKQELNVKSRHGACNISLSPNPDGISATCNPADCEVTISPNPHPAQDNIGHLKVSPLKAGDLVLCICAERDISSSVNGMSTVPPVGHHDIANAIVVGLFGPW